MGLLIAEGHFRVTGRYPEVSLRLHTRHEALVRWLAATFPGSRLYGPYHHGGRSYFQWMARGTFLRDVLVPLLEQHLTPELDAHAYTRFVAMRDRFGLYPGSGRAPTAASRRWIVLSDTSGAGQAEVRRGVGHG